MNIFQYINLDLLLSSDKLVRGLFCHFYTDWLEIIRLVRNNFTNNEYKDVRI